MMGDMTAEPQPAEPGASWVVACPAAELTAGEVVQLPQDPPIAVFNVDGEFFATDDTCTHETASLAEGYVDGDVVECAFHFAKFCIRTGAAMSYPATEPLATYPVQVSEGQVLVDVAHPSVRRSS
jgi:3-phenylpropionate/trans-cinnamate dioxygenase ferredoxin component